MTGAALGIAFVATGCGPQGTVLFCSDLTRGGAPITVSVDVGDDKLTASPHHCSPCTPVTADIIYTLRLTDDSGKVLATSQKYVQTPRVYLFEAKEDQGAPTLVVSEFERTWGSCVQFKEVSEALR